MVEPTTYPSASSPVPAPPAKRRGCLSWPVLIAGGCLTVLLVGALIVVAIVAIPLMALRSCDAYRDSLDAARASAAVREDFGEPLTPSWFVGGRVNVVDDSGSVEIEYAISGPKAQGAVIAKGTKANGVWTYSTLCMQRADGKVYDLLTGASGLDASGGESGVSTPEKLITRPLPEFLKGTSPGVTPERAPVPTLPPAPPVARLTPIDASFAQVESAFMAALLNNKPEQALASASNSFLLEGGIEVLKSFGELAQERGGGTFTPLKTTQLDDGHSAVVGEVVFGDGTKMKVTVLTRAGKVEGFTSAR